MSWLGDLHSRFGWVAVSLSGLAGFFGIALWVIKRAPGRAFFTAAWLAITAVLAQVSLGLLAMNLEASNPGNQHVFYGVVISFTLAFAYIYRAQLRKRPALYYGLLMLFVMGLGIRGIMTFGKSF